MLKKFLMIGWTILALSFFGIMANAETASIGAGKLDQGSVVHWDGVDDPTKPPDWCRYHPLDC